MTQSRRPNAAGKWLAATLVALGLLAAAAEYKFRVVRPRHPSATTLPAW